jgi:hypothetical protein
MLKQAGTEGGRKRGKKIRHAVNPVSEYEFVTSIGPPSSTSKTAAAKQVVRVHAMRSFIRQRDAKLLDGGSKSKTIPSRQTQVPIAGKFKLDSWSRKSSKRRSTTPEVVEEEATIINEKSPSMQPDLGPFELLNIPLTPQVRRLLHHCMDMT